jgi:hypothetical protein
VRGYPSFLFLLIGEVGFVALIFREPECAECEQRANECSDDPAASCTCRDTLKS